MAFEELLRSALRSLGGNRLRTALTMLGVVIGVGSVVGMIALGEGARKSVEGSIRSMGTNLLSIRPGSPSRFGVRSGTSETLTEGDARAIEDLPGIAAMAPDATGMAQVEYLTNNASTVVVGATPEWLGVRAFELADGAFIRPPDLVARRRVAVLGSFVAQTLFAALDPIGERIQVKGVPFVVVGVLEEKGTSGFGNPDDQIVVPLTTYQSALFGTDKLSGISVQVADGVAMDVVQADIERVIRSRHRIPEGQEDDFRVRSQTEMLQTMNEVTGAFTALLGGVAAVSLLVGGIGIMNIMLVSVRERTREIGIRKAVGARRRDILLQFLVEAIFVSVVGGLFGLALGYGLAFAMSRLANWEAVVPPYAVVLALGTSIGIGVVFGVWPARQAARLDPVEALRYE